MNEEDDVGGEEDDDASEGAIAALAKARRAATAGERGERKVEVEAKAEAGNERRAAAFMTGDGARGSRGPCWWC